MNLLLFTASHKQIVSNPNVDFDKHQRDNQLSSTSGYVRNPHSSKILDFLEEMVIKWQRSCSLNHQLATLSHGAQHESSASYHNFFLFAAGIDIQLSIYPLSILFSASVHGVRDPAVHFMVF